MVQENDRTAEVKKLRWFVIFLFEVIFYRESYITLLIQWTGCLVYLCNLRSNGGRLDKRINLLQIDYQIATKPIRGDIRIGFVYLYLS